MTLAEIRATPLSIDECLAAVRRPDAGGTAVFAGTVRDHDGGRTVTRLDYSAHPSAAAEIRRVAAGVAAGDGVLAVAVVHRTGALAVGDLAIVCAVAAAHRDVAFAACRRLVDEVKETVPIWKHQAFADGGAEWVGVPAT